ncbi:MAG: hypothetical protein EOP36_03090 [Rubrivivax sp.]|nr:MAG: hypothetical protein EOP36_03090 [Rubrivivax sp.]
MDTLKSSDLQTGFRKCDEVRDEVLCKMPEQAEFINSQIFHKKCQDLNSIEAVFTEIKKECNSSTFPLIFFDAHGDKERGLQLSSGEYLDWDLFNLKLEEITYAAHGNLTVVASFCHSMSALKKPDFGKPLPCPFYYGYSDEVLAGDVENESKQLIQALIQHGKLDEKTMKIELYSEYKHAELLISPLIVKFTNPQGSASILPELSKNKLRQVLLRDLAKTFGTTKNFNKHFAKITYLPFLIEYIIRSSMHDTERRSRFIAEVVNQIQRLNDA